MSAPSLKPKINLHYDPDQVLRHARIVLASGLGCVEVRVLDADLDRRDNIIAGGKYQKTIAGWFDDPNKLLEAVRRIRGVSAFITANPVTKDLLARVNNRLAICKSTTTDANIVGLHHWFIDFDPKRPTGISSTDAESAAAVARRDRFLVENPEIRAASYWGTSGNGTFLLVRLPGYPNDEEHTKLVAKATELVVKRYSDDQVELDTSVKNPARIMSLAGTMKCKGEDLPDRPYRMARIEGPDVEPITLDLKAWLAGQPEEAEAKKPTEPPKKETQAKGSKPTRAKATGTLERARKCVFAMKDSIEGQKGHSQLYGVAVALVDGFGLDKEDAITILTEWNAQKAKPPESAKQVAHKIAQAIKNFPNPSLRLLNAPFPSDVGDDERTDGSGGPEPGQAGSSPEPDDGPSEDIVDRWPKLDEAAFHGLAGKIVRAAMPHTEADAVAVLLQFLVGFANAVGRGPHWVAGATHHYLVMFCALVGPTASGRKGSSWDVARFFLGALDRQWATDRISQGLTSGEGLIYHVRDPVTKLDKDGEEVIEDPGVKDKRLLLIESEYGRTLKVMSQERNILSAVMRQAWDCNNQLVTLTKNSPNVASNPHVSIIGHITSEELESLLKGTESANGFGNRFLWACVRESKDLPEGGEFFQQDWDPIIKDLSAVYFAAKNIGLMTRDAESGKIWREVYPDLKAGKPGLLGAMLARGLAQVMRIACIYAVLDGSRFVRSPHMLAALAIWEYAEASARFIFGESLGDPRAERLLEALKASPQGMKRSEISIKVFSRNLDATRLAKLLERLLSLGLIHRIQSQGAVGRKSELWFAGRASRATR
jgi:hypothetical protein